MSEIKEIRDAADTTTELPSVPSTPPSHCRTTIPSSLLQHSPTDHHHADHLHHHPQSPPSRKAVGKVGGMLYHARPRAQSLCSSAYNTNPLLIPQSPPPVGTHMNIGTGNNGRRNLSLSPQLRNAPTVPSFLAGNPMMRGSNNEQPPRVSETQKAMEAAVMAERKRAKELQAEETGMSADELRGVLKRERQRLNKYAADLARLKSAAVQCQAEAEVLEEGRINGLMRRLENLQIEKGRIINELEREEEMVRRKNDDVLNRHTIILLNKMNGKAS
jgi:hypothetical protein